MIEGKASGTFQILERCEPDPADQERSSLIHVEVVRGRRQEVLWKKTIHSARMAGSSTKAQVVAEAKQFIAGLEGAVSTDAARVGSAPAYM